MSGAIKLPHKCPSCGVVAKDRHELESLFGLRVTPNGLTNQSQCKRCR